jgi:spectinomycin phosphotransferase/16S rRNA (guanine(1405)-N(7))-methyltransferase
MLVGPADLPDSAVVDALMAGWGLGIVSAEYLPLGFGSHHWRIVDDQHSSWFATVDDLRLRLLGGSDSVADARARLRAALVTTRAIADAGSDFAVAPIRRTDTEVLGVIGDTYTVALYPYVEGRHFGFGDELGPQERPGVVEILAELHSTAEPIRRTAMVESFEVPQRELLLGALRDLANVWETGPYGEPARELLAAHASLVESMLARHDGQAVEARRHPERMVLTHGEPHPGNLIETSEGWRLVDWDTTLIAPPERDLWLLHPTDHPAESAYSDHTGRRLERPMLTYYRQGWALNDIAAFVSQFRAPHGDDANQRAGWTELVGTMSELQS